MRDLKYADLHDFGDGAPDDLDNDHALELAQRLAPAMGESDWIRAQCFTLVQAAREWACLQVHAFNTYEDLEGDDADREEELRTLMDQAVGRLPETDAGPIRLDLDYEDIRGVLVKLVLPGEWSRLHTTFTGSGMAVEV